MGTTTWPCPHCGQQQKAEAPNGVEVKPTLCASCLEAYSSEQEEILTGSGSKGAKEKALDALDEKFGISQAFREKGESAETV